MVINGNSQIHAVGVSLPPQIVTSISLMEEIDSANRFDLPLDWIDTRVGIEKRRVAAPGTMPSDLATEASINALENSGINPEHISMIIYCGIEKDFMEPGTAHIVQRNLGSNGVCMDVTNACQGLISGVSVADAFIASGAAESVLVCSGEIMNKNVRRTIDKINEYPKDFLRDRLGFLTVGDAGSAVILTRKNETSGIKNLLFDSQGEYADYCYYRYKDNGDIEGQMLMRGINSIINSIHLKMISNTYHYLDWEPADVDVLACHQVGKRSVRDLCNIADIKEDIVPITYKEYGNTASCSIPLALSIANPSKGDKILLMGGGSGLSSFQGGLIW